MITIHIHYTGHNGSARKFAEEMLSSKTVEQIRAESGNLGYNYYLSLDDPETLLLIDSWRDQASIDAHHASPMMQTIAALREKYDLKMRVERFVSDDGGIPDKDRRVYPRMTLERRSAIIHENNPRLCPSGLTQLTIDLHS